VFSFCKVVSVVVSVVCFLPALCLLALVAFPVPLHGLKPLHFLYGFEALAPSLQPDPKTLQTSPSFLPSLPASSNVCARGGGRGGGTDVGNVAVFEVRGGEMSSAIEDWC